MSYSLPWQMPELRAWDIVGMNHYRSEGQRHLFVAMVRDGRCIKAEGRDPLSVFNALRALAAVHNRQIEREQVAPS